MSLFQSEYQKALMTTRDYSAPNEPALCVYPDIPTDTLENLYYILNYGIIQVKYPYSMTIGKLHAYLVLYTLDGQGLLVYEKQKYLLKPNSILFIDCQKGFHIEVFHSSNWSYQWFYINGNATPYLYQQFIFDDIPIYEYKTLSSLHNIFSKLIDYSNQRESNDFVCSMLIDTLLTTLTLEKHSIAECDQIPKYIKEVKKLFDDKYYESYDLDNLAKTFKISKYTLSREFTKYIKSSPIEYLISKRINVAKKLLIESDYTINEIALKIGIDNATHFINLFKKRIGITPLQYRKQRSKELGIFIDY